MEMSLCLAKILGAYCVVVSFAVLCNMLDYKEMIKDFAESRICIFFSGIIALWFGLIVAAIHNVWQGWPVIITLFGWMALIKGIVILIYPQFFLKIVLYYAEHFKAFVWQLAFVVAIGIMLLLFGFGIL